MGYLKLHRSGEVFATLAEAARRDDQSHLEFLAALAAEEAAATRQRRLSARLRSPTSRPGAASRSSTSASSPPSNPKVIADLAGLGFAEAGTPVLAGAARPPGHRTGHRGGRSRLPRLLHHRHRHGGGHDHRLRQRDLRHQDAPTPGRRSWLSTTWASPPFDWAQANAFFQVVNRRDENRSATIVTANRDCRRGPSFFAGDSVVAAAVLLRLLDGATVINIKGNSSRLREHQALTQRLTQLNDRPESPRRRRR